ncbi:MAG: fructose PTS transporter subunit IIB [Tetragenococcus koreensis]|uniref:PTS fructose transporter subunit IIB n=1 Tax=Tetragenococcus halophilus TaxID=51669 RepID=UPI001F18906F|nr:fructose PTS transporter subunit IIB [Tetragenococcus halophilus]MDN6140700.1 fructose PTS transporter subunit IIB [Tetragenococcus koreensis]MDN6569994.1 fructose PTS transporter subunit IIB [Staphylococcus equorum]MCF1602545.1 fructose PTS transporter subunit IIB [Tetragenococcus halophilus]MDN6146499.1 fructose PTS transporter subunit IIB [Tetragenococcus koreensis]MDN6166403.1 fructose PTS transporter subunit IIB [Tetragenococcus koreensis]
MKKIVAVCACPMGVAHTYMAADAIEEAAKKLNMKVSVETQGAGGIEDKLKTKEIQDADLILFATAVKVSQTERFEDYKEKLVEITLKEAINDSERIIQENT